MPNKKSKKPRTRKVGRSAVTGEFITKDEVKANPGGTVTDTVDLPSKKKKSGKSKAVKKKAVKKKPK
jgi:hypothetical protein